jgi:hypothetical protein
MVKFVVTRDDQPVLGLGLTDENLEDLRTGRPIVVKVRELVPAVAIDLEVLIFHGRTTYDITEQIAGLIGPDTEIRRQ